MKPIPIQAWLGVMVAGVLLVGCAAKAPTPDWKLEAQSASERAVQAYLEGHTRVAQAQWSKAFNEVAATGQPGRMARVALLQCAAQTAALEVTDCPRYQRYALGADPVEQAYARYLLAQHTAADVPLLPTGQQKVALQLVQGSAIEMGSGEPLSQLTAAGVALRAGAIDKNGVEHAIEVASGQGWRRALMAWLAVAQRMAQQAGDAATVQAMELRLQILQEAEGGGNQKK